MKTMGFTLVELMISVAFVTIISLLGFVVVYTAASSGATSSSHTATQSGVRDALQEVVRELEQGAKPDTATQFAGVTRMEVLQDGAIVLPGQTGNMVRFQTPLDGLGTNWSAPIQYRFEDEDANGNGYLDPGEDTAGTGNNDGILTRRLVREQDLNGDGDFADPSETRIIGASNDIANVTFVLNPNRTVVSINLQATRPLSGRGRVVMEDVEGVMTNVVRSDMVGSNVSTQVQVLN